MKFVMMVAAASLVTGMQGPAIAQTEGNSPDILVTGQSEAPAALFQSRTASLGRLGAVAMHDALLRKLAARGIHRGSRGLIAGLDEQARSTEIQDHELAGL